MRDPAPRPEAEARQLGVAERETVRGGVSGVVVDPDDPVSTVSGIRDALVQENGPPGGLDHSSRVEPVGRRHTVVDEVFVRDHAPAAVA